VVDVVLAEESGETAGWKNDDAVLTREGNGVEELCKVGPPVAMSFLTSAAERRETVSYEDVARYIAEQVRKSSPLWERRSAWRSEEHYLGGNRTRLIGSRPRRRGLLRCGNSR
jgi:hypothetical protein